MKNRIIAFAGKAQAGKTESSKILKVLAEKDGIIFKKLSFADGLKDIAKEYFDWDGDKGIYLKSIVEMDGQIIIPDKGRSLLINIGKKFREIRPTIWADLVYKKIIEFDKQNPENVFYCLDDLRFRNEIDILNKYNNTEIVRVIRENGQLNIDDISEKDCDDVVFENILQNNGTLEDLARSVGDVYKIAITGN